MSTTSLPQELSFPGSSWYGIMDYHKSRLNQEIQAAFGFKKMVIAAPFFSIFQKIVSCSH